ncbi:MAG TPA: MliC family protein [Thauera sp.]|nr:MliC family protein [Thauera sp.]
MKTFFPLTFASILLVSACSSSPQVSGDEKMPAAAAASAHKYQCESGEVIAATYPSTDSATIKYKGSNYNMQIAVSASGARYVGGGFEWWTKGSGAGSEAILFHHMADDSSGSIIEVCSESRA